MVVRLAARVGAAHSILRTKLPVERHGGVPARTQPFVDLGAWTSLGSSVARTVIFVTGQLRTHC